MLVQAVTFFVQEKLIAVFSKVLTLTLYLFSVILMSRLKQSAIAFSYFPTFSAFSFQHIVAAKINDERTVDIPNLCN